MVIICPNSHDKLTKLDQIGVDSNIAQNHLSSTYEVISGHYFPRKLTKSEIM